MKSVLRKVVMVPMVNSVLRGTVKFFVARSRFLVKTMTRYIHVSGVINIVVENQPIALWAQGDDALVSKLYYNNDWERNVTFWFSKFCTRNTSVVDAGANIGIFSLLAAKVNTDAVVHAFEPNPFNFLRLKKNIAMNGMEERVKAHQSALGNRHSDITFHLPADERISDVSSVYRGHATSFNDFPHREIQVSSVPLDKFCEANGVTPQLVKIDVELYELQVMQGMKSILAANRPFIFCEIFNDEVKRKLNPALDAELETGYTNKVQEFMEAAGYYFYWIFSEGILHVDSLKLNPVSCVYLLLPVKLKQSFYLSAEADMVLDELSRV